MVTQCNEKEMKNKNQTQKVVSIPSCAVSVFICIIMENYYNQKVVAYLVGFPLRKAVWHDCHHQQMPTLKLTNDTHQNDSHHCQGRK